jgi:pyruvate formate lyase activating enzyme
VTVGTIFDIKKFAIHDGPGIRTTVFFKGCPLHCWLCHNPESQAYEPELLIREEGAELCPQCAALYHEGALQQRKGTRRIDSGSATLCEACSLFDLRGDIQIAGRQVTVEEVMEEIARDVVFYEQSGGGATFSGGEPLAQPEFLDDLLVACTEAGIHTVVDTSGYAATKNFDRILPNVDLFLYDLKVVDDERHKRFTGVSTELIHTNLSHLVSEGANIIVRIPLLPGINDDEENLRAVGSLVASLDGEIPVELLPYHRAGQEKYARLGRDYRLPNLEPPIPEMIDSASLLLRQSGVTTLLQGNIHESE